ncbi:hypothetical protein L195_g047441, partial [Trifolium pratense]
GDTPHEKRPKLGSNAVEVKGKAVEVKVKDKMSKTIDAAESANPDEFNLLNLTEMRKCLTLVRATRMKANRMHEELFLDFLNLGRKGLQSSLIVSKIPSISHNRKFLRVSIHECFCWWLSLSLHILAL